MGKSESTHDKLSRVRKPHVHITYTPYTPDGGEQVRELPFVVGVLGDFQGSPTVPVKPMREREFINIDRDNFGEVMRRLGPGVSARVPNRLSKDGGELAVRLRFDSMEDFSPASVARQVEPLRKLLEVRELLKSFLSRADRSPALEELLEQILRDTATRDRVQHELARPA
jgi:type VI secretion system protein ImpB